MASGKRKSDGTDLPPQKKTRSVKTSTCDKWIADNDVSLSTSVWLKYDCCSGDRLVADSLKCSVCIQFHVNLYILSILINNSHLN